MHICDQICQKGSYVRNYKCWEISFWNFYLENAWCLVYEILHQSIVIQGNSVGVLFDGLLAELPAILDSFFISTASDYIGVVGWGWWGATKWQGKHTLCSHACIMDPLVPELAQKVVKSVDITTRSCETLELGGLCLTASRDSWIQTEHSWKFDVPQKAASGKADWWTVGHNTCIYTELVTHHLATVDIAIVISHL